MRLAALLLARPAAIFQVLTLALALPARALSKERGASRCAPPLGVSSVVGSLADPRLAPSPFPFRPAGITPSSSSSTRRTPTGAPRPGGGPDGRRRRARPAGSRRRTTSTGTTWAGASGAGRTTRAQSGRRAIARPGGRRPAYPGCAGGCRRSSRARATRERSRACSCLPCVPVSSFLLSLSRISSAVLRDGPRTTGLDLGARAPFPSVPQATSYVATVYTFVIWLNA